MNDHSKIKEPGMAVAVRQVGDSWSLLILWMALHGTTRYEDFQNQLGIARNVLSQRLSRLVEVRILVRRPIRSGSRRMEYGITKKGKALRPALEKLDQWGQDTLQEGSSKRSTP